MFEQKLKREHTFDILGSKWKLFLQIKEDKKKLLKIGRLSDIVIQKYV